MRGRKRQRIKLWKAQGYTRKEIQAFAHLGQRSQAFVLNELMKLPWLATPLAVELAGLRAARVDAEQGIFW